jgi:hypothetical protein
MLLAEMVHPKVYGGAVSRSGKHQTVHVLGDPYLFLFRESFLLRLLVVVVTPCLVRALGLFLVVEGCYPILSSELFPCLL